MTSSTPDWSIISTSFSANNKGELVVIGRSCELVIHDEVGRERERHKVPYGATLLVQDGSAVKAGQTLATWDPHTRTVITAPTGKAMETGVSVPGTVTSSPFPWPSPWAQ